MKLVSGIVDSGFFAQSALSAEIATKDSLGRNISETYLTAVDIPESATWNATTQTVSANSAQWAGGTANPQIPVTGINGIKISESGDKVVFEVSGDYYTNDNPSGFISEVPDTYLQNTDLSTEDGKVTAISGIPLSAGGDVPEGYATTGDLAAVSAKVAPSGIAVFQMYAPSSTYSAVTAAINAGKMVYAKDSDTYLPLTRWNSFHQILYFGSGPGGMGDGHATFTGDATMLIATLCNQHTGGDYSYGWSNSTTAIPNNSLVNNKLDKSAFSTVSSTFYTTANPSGFISEVPATYLQNTDLEISDNKITGISGVPLAASTNETVLWSGTGTSGDYNLSESYKNFEKISITHGCTYSYNDRGLAPDSIFDVDTFKLYNCGQICLTDMTRDSLTPTAAGGARVFYNGYVQFSAVNDTKLHFSPCTVIFNTLAYNQNSQTVTGKWVFENSRRYFKIVGINRIANN